MPSKISFTVLNASICLPQAFFFIFWLILFMYNFLELHIFKYKYILTHFQVSKKILTKSKFANCHKNYFNTINYYKTINWVPF